LCVPYLPEGFAPANIIPLMDRAVYPQATFPAGQWEYQLFYEENFEAARTAFEASVPDTVKALFRAGKAAGKGQPSRTPVSPKARVSEQPLEPFYATQGYCSAAHATNGPGGRFSVSQDAG
jgi:hypothetical protein